MKCLIYSEDKILLLQRGKSAPTFPNYWDLPGGLLDESELPDEAIVREISEETHLEVNKIELDSTTVFVRKEEPTLVLFYKANYVSGVVQLSSEHQNFKWVDHSELLQMEMQPWISNHLRKFLQKN